MIPLSAATWPAKGSRPSGVSRATHSVPAVTADSGAQSLFDPALAYVFILMTVAVGR
jgi:hypothetical protein